MVFTLSMASCGVNDKGSASFVTIDRYMVSTLHTGRIVYCKSTKVMYAVSSNGEFTLLVDENGNPMLYDGK